MANQHDEILKKLKDIKKVLRRATDDASTDEKRSEYLLKFKEVNDLINVLEARAFFNVTLPKDIKDSVGRLDAIAEDVKNEGRRIEDITRRVEKFNEYVGYAVKLIEYVVKVLA